MRVEPLPPRTRSVQLAYEQAERMRRDGVPESMIRQRLGLAPESGVSQTFTPRKRFTGPKGPLIFKEHRCRSASFFERHTVGDLLQAAASMSGYSMSEILSACRAQRFMPWRAAISRVLVLQCGYSFPQAARALNRKDHTSILHLKKAWWDRPQVQAISSKLARRVV